MLNILVPFAGGLGLFLYGMHVMAAGLQKSASKRMKQLLAVLTTSKLRGILVGALVTAIIQSSSATTVMVVGFVNAGIMNLAQSIGIIMGANIGTTVTSWIVSSMEWSKLLNPVSYAPIAIIIGALMVLFGKTDRVKFVGEIIVGFGILFLGMSIMSDSVKPLRKSQALISLFTTLGHNPLLGILAGVVVTAVIQSSSASVGILQSFAASGLIPWSAAVYIIMGQNIGTCVTALMSSIGASKNARAAAYVHLLFNIIGAVFFSILAVLYFKFINPALGIETIGLTQISIVHTSFNIANTIVLFPFSGFIMIAAQKLALSKTSEPDEADLVHLDDRILETPTFAVENCLKEIVRMGYIATENLLTSVEALVERNSEKIAVVATREEAVDRLCFAISQYLIKLSNIELNKRENKLVLSYFQIVSDIERVSDHSENIAELATLYCSEDITFSPSALEELTEVIRVAISCYKRSIEALETGRTDLAMEAMAFEEQLDSLEKHTRDRHLSRLSSSECQFTTGVIYLDTIRNLERVTDHARNISEAVVYHKTLS